MGDVAQRGGPDRRGHWSIQSPISCSSLLVAGVDVGDLVSLGGKVVFYSQHKDLSSLDGRTFASADGAGVAVAAAFKARL